MLGSTEQIHKQKFYKDGEVAKEERDIGAGTRNEVDIEISRDEVVSTEKKFNEISVGNGIIDRKHTGFCGNIKCQKTLSTSNRVNCKEREVFLSYFSVLSGRSKEMAENCTRCPNK